MYEGAIQSLMSSFRPFSDWNHETQTHYAVLVVLTQLRCTNTSWKHYTHIRLYYFITRHVGIFCKRREV